MKAITPEEMQGSKANLMIARFNTILKQEDINQLSYHLIYYDACSNDDCKKIEEAYKEAGWKDANCESMMNSVDVWTSLILTR